MNKTLTTPAGVARYPRLNSPDTKFSEEGQYKVDLEMSAEDAEPFLKQIEAMFSEFVADKKRELKKDTLKIHAAPWTENDGMVQLKLKVKATGKKKETGEEYSRKPTLFNASGQITNENIGGGSRLKVAVVPYFWYTASLGAGITLQPKAVQILDLVTWSSGGTAEAYGFEVTEAKDQHVERELRVAKNGTNNEEVEW
jgi:hypothetical protein